MKAKTRLSASLHTQFVAPWKYLRVSTYLRTFRYELDRDRCEMKKIQPQ